MYWNTITHKPQKQLNRFSEILSARREILIGPSWKLTIADRQISSDSHHRSALIYIAESLPEHFPCIGKYCAVTLSKSSWETRSTFHSSLARRSPPRTARRRQSLTSRRRRQPCSEGAAQQAWQGEDSPRLFRVWPWLSGEGELSSFHSSGQHQEEADDLEEQHWAGEWQGLGEGAGGRGSGRSHWNIGFLSVLNESCSK